MAIEAINAIGSGAASEQIVRILAEVTMRTQRSASRLSAGIKNVSPEIDPAGLAQFMKLDAQINRISAAETNVTNAVSFSQTQDAMLGQSQVALNRMGELSILAQDQTKSADDRAIYQMEFTQLQNFLSDIGNQTFNGVNLFSSSDVQVTADSGGNQLTLNGADLAAPVASGGLAEVISGASISTPAAAASALDTIKSGIQNVANLRANAGANLQSLNFAKESNAALSQNLSAAGSRLNDVDVAEESRFFAGSKLILQAGVQSLRQANLLIGSMNVLA
ncbi:MAG: flagellin [Verrucomicrobia bacterium]|nr:flagellin [Verrucomicrobiota bacterium]